MLITLKEQNEERLFGWGLKCTDRSVQYFCFWISLSTPMQQMPFSLVGHVEPSPVYWKWAKLRVHDWEGSGASAGGRISILIKSRLPLLLLPVLLVTIHMMLSGAVVSWVLHGVRTVVADHPSPSFQTVPCSQQRGHLVLSNNLGMVVRVNILTDIIWGDWEIMDFWKNKFTSVSIFTSALPSMSTISISSTSVLLLSVSSHSSTFTNMFTITIASSSSCSLNPHTPLHRLRSSWPMKFTIQRHLKTNPIISKSCCSWICPTMMCWNSPGPRPCLWWCRWPPQACGACCPRCCATAAEARPLPPWLLWGCKTFSKTGQKPGHACPVAAAGCHVRPAPGVPGDARGPWRRWVAGALGKKFHFLADIFVVNTSKKIIENTSNSITFSNLVGGRLPPSLDREDTELLPFLLLHDLPEEPCSARFKIYTFSEKYIWENEKYRLLNFVEVCRICERRWSRMTIRILSEV